MKGKSNTSANKTVTLKDKKDNVVKVTFHAPASLRKSFKIKAASEDRSVKNALCLLMQAYVEGKIQFIEV